MRSILTKYKQSLLLNMSRTLRLIVFIGVFFAPISLSAEEPGRTIKVGILYSQTRSMAVSETSLHDAVLMAIEEINATGGVLGKQIEPVVIDPASDWELFTKKAKEWLVDEQVAVVFGCWTPVSRKQVLSVFEQYQGLLFYLVQYEGQDMELNISYTGATPKQQLIPAMEFIMSEDGGAKRKFFLLGTDDVFSHTANKTLRAYLLSQGILAENIREEYYPFSHKDYTNVIAKIKAFSEEGDAAVLTTLSESANGNFYEEFMKQDLFAKDVPIMTFSSAGDELHTMDPMYLEEHLAAWDDFQSIKTSKSEASVNTFTQHAKTESLPGGVHQETADPIETAYFGTYVWKAAVEKAQSVEVDKVIPYILGQELGISGEQKQTHSENDHIYKPVYIGDLHADGQFDIIWMSEVLIESEAFSQ